MKKTIEDQQLIEKLEKTCISNIEEIEHLNEVIYFMPISPTYFDHLMFLENCVDYSLSLPENVFDGCVGISHSVFHEILDLVDKVSHNWDEDGEKRKNRTYKQKKCSDKIQLFVCLIF